MVVVFHNVDPTLYPFAGPGIAGGPFTLIDEEGHLVSAFAGANVMSKDDRVLRLTPEGELALAQVIHYGASLAWTVRVLHVTPIAPSQLPTLSVILGPASLWQDAPCDDDASWTWRADGPEEGSALRIEIGPQGANGGIEDVAATFTFDPKTARFRGPSGGGSTGFKVVTDEEPHTFAAADTWAARSIVRVRDLTEDLPVEHEHEVLEGAKLELLEKRWPIPSDSLRRLLLRTRGGCALTTLQLRQADAWTGTVSPNGPQLRVPLEVLRAQGGDPRLGLELEDACRGGLWTTISPPP